MDDLRWDDLGCTGHPFVKTPNIDRIAREGALFRNAFATTPLCSPSRASFLTGRYPHAHGVVDNVDRSALSHRLVTLPLLLHRAGYETGYVGKWHMGIDDSRRPGFDYWVSVKGQGDYVDPELNEDGRVAKVRGYVTDIFNDRAVAFLKRPRTKPFLLYIAHKAVHPDLIQFADGRLSDPSAGIFRPAERHRTLYAEQPVPRRPNVADRARWQAGPHAAAPRPTAARPEHRHRRRDGPQPPAGLDGRRRRRRPDPRGARANRQARRYPRHLHQRSRLFLRRAWPERRAPAGLRGSHPHPAC